MCIGCYEKLGSPQIFNEKIWRAVKFIEEVYGWSSTGGACHIVVDDWNLEDRHIQSCRKTAQEWLRNDDDYSLTHFDIDVELLDWFEKLTVDERASALAFYEGFWIPEIE